MGQAPRPESRLQLFHTLSAVYRMFSNPPPMGEDMTISPRRPKFSPLTLVPGFACIWVVWVSVGWLSALCESHGLLRGGRPNRARGMMVLADPDPWTWGA